MILLEHLDHPDIQEFLNWKDKQLKEAGKIIVESPKVVKKLLSEKVTIDKILCTQEFFEENLTQEKIEKIFIITPNLFKEITGHNKHPELWP